MLVQSRLHTKKAKKNAATSIIDRLLTRVKRSVTRKMTHKAFVEDNDPDSFGAGDQSKPTNRKLKQCGGLNDTNDSIENIQGP